MARSGATVVSFRWELPPSAQIVPGLASYERKLVQAIGMLADLFAAKMEAAAKAGAPWTDQSGAARQGLRGFAVKAATSVVIYLVHSVEYGIWLELGTSRMAPRPILLPVLQTHYGSIMQALRALVGA